MKSSLIFCPVMYQELSLLHGCGTFSPKTQKLRKITFFHKNGVVTVDIEKLPPELRKRLGYDPKNAAADRATSESERRERARQRADDSANEQAEKQEADERAPPSEDYEDKIKIGRWYVDKTIATFIGICGACLVALLLGVWIMLSKK